MSVVFVSCARQNTLVTLKYHFHNDTEHIIEIKNYYGNGQIDYYKINPNEYLFLEKYTIFAESPKSKPERFNFELPEWYEDGKYYVSTDARSLANKDAYTFELRKRKKRKSDFRYDAYYRFTEADYLEAVND